MDACERSSREAATRRDRISDDAPRPDPAARLSHQITCLGEPSIVPHCARGSVREAEASIPASRLILCNLFGSTREYAAPCATLYRPGPLSSCFTAIIVPSIAAAHTLRQHPFKICREGITAVLAYVADLVNRCQRTPCWRFVYGYAGHPYVS